MWRYNCARVYVDEYVVGGANEDGKWVECKYQLIDGDIITKRIRPIRVKGTNSEGTAFTLQTFVLYPKTETATEIITNGRRKFTIQLIKAHIQRSTMFKLKL